MSDNQNLPFIPAWLDESGLSPAEFRIYSHLCRRADNATGIAWPSYKAMVETCGSSKTTIRRCLERLEEIGLIANMGKPFAGSCRYRPIVPPEGQLDGANSSTTGTIEAAPIVPPVAANSSTRGTPIVPPEGQEGTPKKVIHRRNTSLSPEAIEFADWFKSTLPQTVNLESNWRQSFAKVHDELVRLDKRTPEQIKAVSRWARADSFWSPNFMSPLKLRKRNRDGTQYFDVFTEKMKTNGTQELKADDCNI
jgi:hypothetical protein